MIHSQNVVHFPHPLAALAWIPVLFAVVPLDPLAPLACARCGPLVWSPGLFVVATGGPSLEAVSAGQPHSTAF